MLKVDQQLMVQQASRLLRGVHYAMKATGASSGIIALKEKYQRAINALTPLLPPDIRLHILPDVYPAGDEVLTIWMATGRRVPPAALPVSVGVVVNNVQTVLNIARAVEQQYPVTRRTLTINGAVAKPITVTVPIGMSLREVLGAGGRRNSRCSRFYQWRADDGKFDHIARHPRQQNHWRIAGFTQLSFTDPTSNAE